MICAQEKFALDVAHLYADVNGGRIGTIADIIGGFSMELEPAKYSFAIGYIGYDPKSINSTLRLKRLLIP